MAGQRKLLKHSLKEKIDRLAELLRTAATVARDSSDRAAAYVEFQRLATLFAGQAFDSLQGQTQVANWQLKEWADKVKGAAGRYKTEQQQALNDARSKANTERCVMGAVASRQLAPRHLHHLFHPVFPVQAGRESAAPHCGRCQAAEHPHGDVCGRACPRSRQRCPVCSGAAPG